MAWKTAAVGQLGHRGRKKTAPEDANASLPGVSTVARGLLLSGVSVISPFFGWVFDNGVGGTVSYFL